MALPLESEHRERHDSCRVYLIKITQNSHPRAAKPSSDGNSIVRSRHLCTNSDRRTGCEGQKWLFIDCYKIPLWGQKSLVASQTLTSRRCIPSASRIATTPDENDCEEDNQDRANWYPKPGAAFGSGDQRTRRWLRPGRFAASFIGCHAYRSRRRYGCQ